MHKFALGAKTLLVRASPRMRPRTRPSAFSSLFSPLSWPALSSSSPLSLSCRPACLAVEEGQPFAGAGAQQAAGKSLQDAPFPGLPVQQAWRQQQVARREPRPPPSVTTRCQLLTQIYGIQQAQMKTRDKMAGSAVGPRPAESRRPKGGAHLLPSARGHVHAAGDRSSATSPEPLLGVTGARGHQAGQPAAADM